MANETQTVMTQIEAIEDLDTLHPRALLMVDQLVVRYGGEAVANALIWLYAEARFDLRVMRERVPPEAGTRAADGDIADRVADLRIPTPRRTDLLLVIVLGGLALLVGAWP